MTVQCITCSRFSFERAAEEWRKQGFGHCELRERFINHGATRERDCPQHQPAAPEVVEKRERFYRANVKGAN